jgi:hypothetical protein
MEEVEEESEPESEGGRSNRGFTSMSMTPQCEAAENGPWRGSC